MSEPFALKIRTKEIARISVSSFADYSDEMRKHIKPLLSSIEVHGTYDDEIGIFIFTAPFYSHLTKENLLSFLDYLKVMDNA